MNSLPLKVSAYTLERCGITIKTAGLGVGDTRMVKIRFKQDRKSMLFLAACLGFHHLAAKEKAAPVPAAGTPVEVPA